MVRNTSEGLSCLKEMYIFENRVILLSVLEKSGVQEALERTTLSFSGHSPKLKARDGLKWR